MAESPLHNETWQAVPGTAAAELFPFLRRPDLLSSNAYLLRTPEQLLLIDTGTRESLTARIDHAIAACRRERPRPLLVLLTHGHIDHIAEAARHWRHQSGTRIALHAAGVRALAAGDRRHTIADLYGEAAPRLTADIGLLVPEDGAREAPRQIGLPGGARLALVTQRLETPCGPWHRQTLTLGEGTLLECYAAPGHSPDSLCLRLGGFLFIGDLLAAASPMVAGISGWNREALQGTLRRLLWLMENEPIALCLPGHGAPIPADRARELIRRLQARAGTLGDVAEMNEDRLRLTTEAALELIDEAEEAFAAVAGRLLYVAHRLETLEAPQAAERCRTAMAMDPIDAALAELRGLCRDLDAGRVHRLAFPHAVLAVVQRLKGLFDTAPLAALLPAALVERAASLPLDFIAIANGQRNPEEFIPADLDTLVDELLQTWSGSPHTDPALIDTADDEERYLTALARRIAHEPPADRVPLRFRAGGDLPLCRLATARLMATLVHFLEWLALDDPAVIHLATTREGDTPVLTIRPEPPPPDRRAERLPAFSRRFARDGLLLEADGGRFRLRGDGA